VEGDGEWLDLEFCEPVVAEEARQRWQRQLPDGFHLLSAAAVPVAGPSLSQELTAARWRFALRPEAALEPIADSPAALAWPEPEAWEEALAALRGLESWIWHDQDKKGRPRQRECRPALRQVRLCRHGAAEPRVELELETRIDGQGFGVRPEHLRSWLSERLGRPLRLDGMRREALLLRTC
jgi:radical SAM-linked protein